MSRSSLTTALRSAVTADGVRAAFLVELDFAGGAVRSTTAAASVTYDGNAYSPDGTFINFSGVEERADGKPPVIEVITHPTSTMKARVNAGSYRNRNANIYLAVFDADYVVIDAIPLGKWKIHQVNYELGNKAQYTIRCEAKQIDLYRAHQVWPSSRTQQQRYATDTYFDAMNITKNIELEWGGKWYGPSEGKIVRTPDGSFQVGRGFGRRDVKVRVGGGRISG